MGCEWGGWRDWKMMGWRDMGYQEGEGKIEGREWKKGDNKWRLSSGKREGWVEVKKISGGNSEEEKCAGRSEV